MPIALGYQVKSGLGTMVLSERKSLRVVLIITAAYFVTELVAGFLTNSLALLSDAIHLLTDIAAICLSLFALWMSSRPASAGKTFGYLRAEILGAMINGLLLWVIAVIIFVEAYGRLKHPEPVAALPVMVVALGGIIVNSVSARLTYHRHEGGRGGMAIRAVFLHVISDMFGAVGVLIAGALVQFTGWLRADPAVSILIAILILYSSWGLVREGIDILMEAVPADIDLEELRNDLLAVQGTAEVHDLHVWCLTTREFALSAHAVVTNSVDSDQILAEMSQVLERKFNIRHMTVQLERDNRRRHEPEHF